MAYLDVFQLQVLVHLVVLDDAEEHGEDVLGGVSEVPEVLEDLVSLREISLEAMFDHTLHQ